MPEQRHAAGNGQDPDLQNPRTRGGQQRHRCASVRGLRLVNASSIARGSSVLLRTGTAPTSERPSARSRGTAHDAFEGIVPERDPAVAVDDAHALVQRFDRPPAAVLVFEPAHVVAVRPVGEIQRDGRDRQDFPHPVVDHLDESHRDAGADEVAADSPGAGCVGHDRLTGCLVRSGTTISADALRTKQYATTAAAIGTPCHGQTKWPSVPPSARCTSPPPVSQP